MTEENTHTQASIDLGVIQARVDASLASKRMLHVIEDGSDRKRAVTQDGRSNFLILDVDGMAIFPTEADAELFAHAAVDQQGLIARVRELEAAVIEKDAALLRSNAHIRELGAALPTDAELEILCLGMSAAGGVLARRVVEQEPDDPPSRGKDFSP